jgi:thiamine pyrophosphate-dependent acetolactate synthase large subunit-like protein
MSLVTPLAFGLAKAIPQRKVIALDGDGSILMGLKTLAARGRSPIFR